MAYLVRASVFGRVHTVLEFIDIKDYRELRVWNLAASLAAELHEANCRLPEREREGLVSEARRAAVEVATAIAKGFTIGSTEAFLEHIALARGELAEVETKLLLARRFDMLGETAHNRLSVRIAEVGLLLRGLQKALQREWAH
jgi:four helix bundle protein